jgi:hypothetical protein
MIPFKIDSYEFGHIVINDQAYGKDLILLPERVIEGWWRKEGHLLQPEDLDAVLEANPKTLVVGQGAYGRMQVTSKTQEALEAADIELIAQPTPKACHTFNRLRQEQSVAAALHLTC